MVYFTGYYKVLIIHNFPLFCLMIVLTFLYRILLIPFTFPHPITVLHPPSGGGALVRLIVHSFSDKQSMLQPSAFDSIAPQGFYPGSRWPSMGPDGSYPEPPKWTDPTIYPIAFSNQGHESYPSDPFPSTSVAGQVDYKMNPMPYYPNPIAHVGYNPQDYQQAFSQWKMPPMKLPKPSSSNPPYRTGPGTNNVRVRTTDKYRMVYSDHQRLELEKEFCTMHFVTSERKTELSTMLNLTERQIKIWFQNRRAKDRRDKHKKS